MGLSLNLKNPRAYELADELARLTGESLTTATIIALEQRLSAEKEKRNAKRKADRIMEFAARFSRGVKKGALSTDHAAFLYDEFGLPK